MKETNDKIVQEYIDRAGQIMIPKVIPKRSNDPNIAISNIIEIAKMIQLEDLRSRDNAMYGRALGWGTTLFKEEEYTSTPSEQKQLEQQSNQK